MPLIVLFLTSRLEYLARVSRAPIPNPTVLVDLPSGIDGVAFSRNFWLGSEAETGKPF